MSCRYPGGITTPEQLWELITSRGDAASSFPEGRGWNPYIVGGLGYQKSEEEYAALDNNGPRQRKDGPPVRLRGVRRRDGGRELFRIFG